MNRKWLLSDFGFSTVLDGSIHAMSTERRGTDSYRAPELVEYTYDTSGNSRPGIASKESDIWAVGCILFQIATTKTFRAFKTDYDTLGYMMRWAGFELPQLKEDYNDALQDKVMCLETGSLAPVWEQINCILEGCLAIAPEAKPSASQLHERFRKMWVELKKSEIRGVMK